MKDKIITAIKTKFPGVNLSRARLNAIAAKIETKVAEDETLIDETVDAFNEFNPFIDIARQDDAMRNLQAKAGQQQQQQSQQQEQEQQQQQQQPTNVDAQMPAWFKPFADELTQLKAEKAQTSMRAKAAELLKDVPAKFWEKRLPQSEAQLQDFASEVIADYTEFKQELTNQNLGALTKGANGQAQTNGGTTGKVSNEVKDFVSKLPTTAAKQEAAAVK